MRIPILTFAVTVMLFISACAPSPKSGKGFTLPDGDVALGKATFEELKCNACHTIEGVEQLPTADPEGTELIALGGEVPRIQTYGELVTSIINPSHRLAAGYAPEDVSVSGESTMKNYNDVMTVDELINVVAFLQSKYELKVIEPTYYPEYGP